MPMQEYIRIHHENEDGIEKYVLRITDWHHKACRVMTNGDREGPICICFARYLMLDIGISIKGAIIKCIYS